MEISINGVPHTKLTELLTTFQKEVLSSNIKTKILDKWLNKYKEANEIIQILNKTFEGLTQKGTFINTDPLIVEIDNHTRRQFEQIENGKLLEYLRDCEKIHPDAAILTYKQKNPSVSYLEIAEEHRSEYHKISNENRESLSTKQVAEVRNSYDESTAKVSIVTEFYKDAQLVGAEQAYRKALKSVEENPALTHDSAFKHELKKDFEANMAKKKKNTPSFMLDPDEGLIFKVRLRNNGFKHVDIGEKQREKLLEASLKKLFVIRENIVDEKLRIEKMKNIDVSAEVNAVIKDKQVPLSIQLALTELEQSKENTTSAIAATAEEIRQYNTTVQSVISDRSVVESDVNALNKINAVLNSNVSHEVAVKLDRLANPENAGEFKSYLNDNNIRIGDHSKMQIIRDLITDLSNNSISSSFDRAISRVSLTGDIQLFGLVSGYREKILQLPIIDTKVDLLNDAYQVVTKKSLNNHTNDVIAETERLVKGGQNLGLSDISELIRVNRLQEISSKVESQLYKLKSQVIKEEKDLIVNRFKESGEFKSSDIVEGKSNNKVQADEVREKIQSKVDKAIGAISKDRSFQYMADQKIKEQYNKNQPGINPSNEPNKGI